MSSNNENSNFKGLGISFLIIIAMMLGTPLLMLAVYG